MTEEWRPVNGYEGRYEVSSLGRIRSLERYAQLRDGRKRKVYGRVLKPSVASHGYYSVSLHKNGASTHSVHVIVATAFGQERPEGLVEVCHVDGNPHNNSAENLRWDSRSGNNRDQVKHGTHPHAFKTHCPQGHPYSEENTYVYDGRRSCRTCHGEATRKHAQKKRLAA